MSTIGAIEIQMMADLARLRQDMNEAKSVVGNAMGGIKSMVSGAMGGLLAGLSVAAFGAWIKGAVDAADEAKNLSQKIGVATKDLAGIQLAFQQAGVGTEGMQKALVSLSKNVANGDDVFKRMGVTVTDSKQALYAIADVFAGMPDGIQKTALATEVFGKAGADMIPMLNEGSAGMKAMADMAARLGLVIDDETAAAADSFNDTVELLGMSTQGMARQVMAQLMPTMKTLAGTLLDNVTSGDKLAKGAQIIATALKGLFSVGAIGVEVFNTLGKTLGGVAAAVISVAKGEFSMAWKILGEAGRDITTGWGETAKTLQAAWSDAGSETVDQANKMTRALKGTTVATKEQMQAAKDAAAEAKKRAAEELKLVTDIAKARSEARQAEAKGIADWELSEDQRRNKEVRGAQDAVAAAQLEFDTHGMLRSEIANVTLTRLQDKQAAFVAGSANYEAVQKEIDAQRELIKILQKGEVRDAGVASAKAAAAEWQKTVDQIGQGLTDSLFRAFESGKSFFSTLWDGIKNLFKTTVLRLAISPVQAGIGSVLGGFSGGASAAGGLGAVGGFAGDVFGSMIGAGTSGAYGGAATAVGQVLPYLAAAGAIVGLVKSLDKSGTMHKGSVVGVGAGGASTLYGDGSQILNNMDQGTDAALRALGIASTGGLNALSGAFGGGGGYGSTLKFAADGQDASIGGFGFSKNGAQMGGSFGLEGGQFNMYSSDREQAFGAYTADVAKATRAAIDSIDLPDWAREQFAALGESASIEELTATIDKVIEAKDALAEVGEVAEELSPAALEAAAAVAKMAENFSAAMSQLSSESAALEVQLLRAGGDESGARSLQREQFLASQDVTEEQRASIAALYDYNQGLRDQITELERATAVGNERAGLERQLLKLNGDTAAIRNIERNALDESNRALYDQINALKDLQSAAAASAIETANAAQAQAEAARVAEAAAQRLAASAAKANAPVTQSGISASAAAMDWTSQSSSAAAIERIKAGKYGANYAAEFARMTGYGSVGVSPAFTAGQEGAFVNGALIADARAQARANPVNRKATGGGGGENGSAKADEQDRIAREQLDGTKDLIDSLNDLRRGLSDFRNDLMGSALDPANPAAKYATEKALAESLGRQALTGDPASIEAFQRQASTFLEMSQGYNASTPAYAADFARMVELLDGIEKRLEKQTTTATATLKIQQAGLGEIAESSRATAKATATSSRTARVTEQRAVE